jgi:radical SAM protein with 4Fe4S-binding SPASM domain
MRLLDELRGCGTLFLTLSGGEIFLREDVFRLLRRAVDGRFSVAIITNGTLIDAGAAARLAELPLRQVGISVYSADPRIHDRMTGVPGSHFRTVEAVKALAAGGTRVVIKTLVTPVNDGRHEKISEWAASLGGNVQAQFDVVVTPAHNPGRRPDRMNLPAHRKADILKEMLKRGDRRPAGGAGEWDTAVPGRRPSSKPCYVGRIGAFIAPDGAVRPCIDWLLDCGNVRDRPFAEIWRGSPGLDFARGFRLDDLKGCLDCGLLAWCVPCPGLNALSGGGDPRIPSPLVCGRAAARKAVVDAADGGADGR